MKRAILLAVRTFREPVKAVIVGMLGGLAGACAMSAFSAAWERLLPASAGRPHPVLPASGAMTPPAMHASQQEWDTTMNTAAVLARKVLRVPLTSERQQERAAMAVHYATGAAFGGAYGLIRESIGDGGLATAAAFGAAVFVVAQEIAVPRMRLSAPLREYSLTMQANSFGEHVAWGVTTELARRAARGLL